MIATSYNDNPVKPVSKSSPEDSPHQHQNFIFYLQHKFRIKRSSLNPRKAKYNYRNMINNIVFVDFTDDL